VETLVGLEEGLLSEVLGVLVVPGELMQKTENAVTVESDDSFKSPWILGERGLDESGLVGGGLRGWRSEFGRVSLRKHRQEEFVGLWLNVRSSLVISAATKTVTPDKLLNPPRCGGRSIRMPCLCSAERCLRSLSRQIPSIAMRFWTKM
jgi:hypothetical protein